MDELVSVKKDEAVCDSLQVSEKFHKQHKNVMRAIDNLLKNEPIKKRKMFFKSTYKDKLGREQEKYFMNRKGFTVLVMGFNGKDALEWKLRYSDAFDTMENFIREKTTDAWIETRKSGKITRQAETDVIKELVEYAKTQGSEHSQMLYTTYSKLANNSIGIANRELATTAQLNQLSFIENIILNQIRVGMEKGLHYKQIYKDCKRQIELFKDIAYLETAV